MDLLSDYLRNKLHDLVKRGQAFSAPATVYFTLLKCTKGLRTNSTAYSVNDTIAVLGNNGKYQLYKCTTAGTTAASQSTLYPGAADEVITDGTAVMTEQSTALQAGTAISEPSGGSYARVAMTANLTNWSGTQGAGTTTASSGTTGTSSNNVAITFTPAPTADWTSGTERVWGWATFDAASAGNLLEVGSLNIVPQAILNGQAAPSFAIGQLTTQYGA